MVDTGCASTKLVFVLSYKGFLSTKPSSRLLAYDREMVT